MSDNPHYGYQKGFRHLEPPVGEFMYQTKLFFLHPIELGRLVVQQLKQISEINSFMYGNTMEAGTGVPK